jgi:hypothetical protein
MLTWYLLMMIIVLTLCSPGYLLVDDDHTLDTVLNLILADDDNTLDTVLNLILAEDDYTLDTLLYCT